MGLASVSVAAIELLTAAESAATPLPGRTLAGSTVLLIVPALDGGARARSTLSIARALVQAGARAIVASEHGEHLDELKGFGGEWLPLSTERIGLGRLRANAAALARFVASEQVQIVHARSAGAAWSARAATRRNGVRLVTDLPDRPPGRLSLSALYLGALSRGDRVIAHSLFNAQPMIARHRIPPDRISIVRRSVDLARFDSITVPGERVLALRRAWAIPARNRVVLAPGRIVARNGQLTLVEAARIMAGNGMSGVTFVLAGDDHRRATRKLWSSARAGGVDALFRVVGHVDDMPSAYATADLVVVPYLKAPVYGRVVAEAQAMARPVIATSVGPLPENLDAPPRSPAEQCSGWVVPPAQPADLAPAILAALALDPPAYRAHAMRARKFAETVFSPQRAAAATLAVYASLLETEAPKLSDNEAPQD